MEPYPSCFCDACLALTYAGAHPHVDPWRPLRTRVPTRWKVRVSGHQHAVPGDDADAAASGAHGHGRPTVPDAVPGGDCDPDTQKDPDKCEQSRGDANLHQHPLSPDDGDPGEDEDAPEWGRWPRAKPGALGRNWRFRGGRNRGGT